MSLHDSRISPHCPAFSRLIGAHEDKRLLSGYRVVTTRATSQTTNLSRSCGKTLGHIVFHVRQVCHAGTLTLTQRCRAKRLPVRLPEVSHWSGYRGAGRDRDGWIRAHGCRSSPLAGARIRRPSGAHRFAAPRSRALARSDSSYPDSLVGDNREAMGWPECNREVCEVNRPHHIAVRMGDLRRGGGFLRRKRMAPPPR
jgi:hypothetical protein